MTGSQKPTPPKEGKPPQKEQFDWKEIYFGYLDAYYVYCAAIEVALAFLHPECHGAPSKPEALKKFGDVLKEGGFLADTDEKGDDVFHLDMGLKDFDTPPDTEVLLSAASNFIIMMKVYLPPFRHVYWPLLWNDHALIEPAHIEKALEVKRTKTWTDLQLEEQMSNIRWELLGYVARHMRLFEHIDSRRRYAHHLDRQLFSAAVTRREDKTLEMLLAEAAFEYWLTQDERAFLWFMPPQESEKLISEDKRILSEISEAINEKMLPSRYQPVVKGHEKPARLSMLWQSVKRTKHGKTGWLANVHTRHIPMIFHLKEYGHGIFRCIEHLILSSSENLFTQEQPTVDDLKLPDALSQFSTFEEWHRTCTKENGPITKMERMIGAARAAEIIEKHKKATRPPVEDVIIEKKVGLIHEQENILSNEGDYWIIVYEGRSITLKDSKGLHYIAYLISRAEQQFHVADLIAEAGDMAVPISDSEGEEMTRSELVQEGLTITEQDDAGAVISPEAKTQYKLRLEKLEEEKETAKALNDIELLGKIEAERDLILEQLSSAYGLGGRARKVDSRMERIRKRVGENIRNTLKRIKELHPALEQHLYNSLRLGAFCMYTPEKPTTWHT